jgi:hypothetical protein
MKFRKGLCRVETKKQIVYGELTEIQRDFILIIDFTPLAVEIKIDKKDIVKFESVSEEDIPPYE